jgi:hypothetical protein
VSRHPRGTAGTVTPIFSQGVFPFFFSWFGSNASVPPPVLFFFFSRFVSFLFLPFFLLVVRFWFF